MMYIAGQLGLQTADIAADLQAQLLEAGHLLVFCVSSHLSAFLGDISGKVRGMV